MEERKTKGFWCQRRNSVGSSLRSRRTRCQRERCSLQQGRSMTRYSTDTKWDRTSSLALSRSTIGSPMLHAWRPRVKGTRVKVKVTMRRKSMNSQTVQFRLWPGVKTEIGLFRPDSAWQG